ncbi:MAG TPA: FHA domain-containing protein [Microcoleaceae cyanobacterium]
MERSYTNVLIISDVEGYRAYRLDRNIYLIGRSQKADIQIFDSKTSRIHSTLIKVNHSGGDHHYRLVDGDARRGRLSQNGTYLNGQPITSKNLTNKDRITFGGCAQAFFLHLDSQLEYDLINVPDRWLREQVNKQQEHETLSVDIPSQLALIPWKSNAITTLDDVSIKPEKPQPAILNSPNSPEFRAAKLQLGQFFVRAAKIQEDQLQNILQQTKASGKRIGELLVEHGLVNESDVQIALKNQSIYLGEILIKRSLITPGQLQHALAQQISCYEKIGQILIKEKLISFDELRDALHEQHLRHNGFWCLK